MDQEQANNPSGRENGNKERQHSDSGWRSQLDKEWFRSGNNTSAQEHPAQHQGVEHPALNVDQENDDDEARFKYWATCRKNFYLEGEYDKVLCYECKRFLLADERKHGLCKACQDLVAIDLRIHQRRGYDALDAILIEELNELAKYEL